MGDMTALCIFIIKSDSCSVSVVGAISVTVALAGINLRQEENTPQKHGYRVVSGSPS